MHNNDATLAVLHQLRSLGVRISMDDFGTGYSSLSYLTRLPIDRVKIDRSFVRNVLTEPQDAAISTAIIAMAGALDYAETVRAVGILADSIKGAQKHTFAHSAHVPNMEEPKEFTQTVLHFLDGLK